MQNDVTAAVAGLSDVGDTTVSAASSGFGSSTIDVEISAPDTGALAAATKQVRAAVVDTPGTSETTDNLASDQPILQVRVDRTKALKAGTSEAAIGQQVTALVSPSKVATMTDGGQTTDVVLQLRGTPDSVKAISDLAIPTPTGVKKLSSLATVERVDVPTTVTRKDSEQSSTVSTTPSGKDLRAVTSDLTTRIDALDLPAGVTTSIGGVSQDQQDSFRQLFLALLAAIAIVYVVMVATFKSLVQPLILLVSVPFAATGAIVALLISGTALGVPSLIGMLMLVGIVVTNAIVLIDLVNQRRREGCRSTTRCSTAPPAPAADPDDGGGDDLRADPDEPRTHRRRRVHLPTAGRRRDRWPVLLDHPHARARAGALQPGRTRPRMARTAARASQRRRACGGLIGLSG